MYCIGCNDVHGSFEHCSDAAARRHREAVSQAEGAHKFGVVELSREDILQRLAIFGVQQAKKTDRGDLLSLLFLLDENDPVRVARGTSV